MTTSSPEPRDPFQDPPTHQRMMVGVEFRMSPGNTTLTMHGTEWQVADIYPTPGTAYPYLAEVFRRVDV